MLIRLCGHFIDNPNHIDKLICIRGLPDEWFFKETKHGKELIRPWTPDVEDNIPKDIRHLCDPVEITFVFPPIEKGKDYVIDKRTVIGLRFDYISEAGQTAWEKIERYLERTVQRDLQIPKPVLVAPNQKSGFDPHAVRRSIRGSLEMIKSEIPVIDLRTSVSVPTLTTSNAPVPAVPLIVNAAPPVKDPEPVKHERKKDLSVVRCVPCGKDFNKQGLRMHNMKKHSEIKEAIGA